MNLSQRDTLSKHTIVIIKSLLCQGQDNPDMTTYEVQYWCV